MLTRFQVYLVKNQTKERRELKSHPLSRCCEVTRVISLVSSVCVYLISLFAPQFLTGWR